MKKKNSHTTKDELQGRAFDNQNLLLDLSCGIDILFIRPFCMYWLPITGNALTGIMAGKVCADVFFIF
jgi:hypothetical protein